MRGCGKQAPTGDGHQHCLYYYTILTTIHDNQSADQSSNLTCRDVEAKLQQATATDTTYIIIFSVQKSKTIHQSIRHAGMWRPSCSRRRPQTLPRPPSGLWRSRPGPRRWSSKPCGSASTASASAAAGLSRCDRRLTACVC